MWKLNRKNRYKIIKEIINRTSDEQIREIINYLNVYGCQEDDSLDYRRNELLNYLDEMNDCWNSNNKDMIDRQYIKIEKPIIKLNNNSSNVCVIFKDEEEEKKFSSLSSKINHKKILKKK